MKTDIRSHAFALTPAVGKQIERRLLMALRSFGRHIDEVSISVRDVNGPRGGRDMLGRVIVRLRRGDPIVVRADDDNINRLVSQLAAAVRRAVKSRIRRRRTRSMRLFRQRQQPSAWSATAEVGLPGEPLENRKAQLAI